MVLVNRVCVIYVWMKGGDKIELAKSGRVSIRGFTVNEVVRVLV
jgi:hypothetical protein